VSKEVKAELLLASHNSWTGDTLYSWKLTFPRIILSEINTHRMACLSGDTELFFDHPSGQTGSGYRRLYTITAKNFYEKWHNGSAPRRNKPRGGKYNIDNVDPNREYTAKELSATTGARRENLNTLVKQGKLKGEQRDFSARRRFGITYIKGVDFIEYVTDQVGVNKQSARGRLSRMRIRQLNEQTTEYQNSTVKDCFYSGKKECFLVMTDAGSSIKASGDHRVLTDSGWKSISELVPFTDKLAGRFCSEEPPRKQPRKVNGVWKCQWNRGVKPGLLKAQDGKCYFCPTPVNEADHVHHKKPVWTHPDLMCDISNCCVVCPPCHKDQHKVQGWQKGVPLRVRWETVTGVISAGFEDTYDFEISGEFPNFVANGLVVHNSRNTSSSRAIPGRKLRKAVLNDPFIPSHIGELQSGMQAGDELSGWKRWAAKKLWSMPRYVCAASAWGMEKLGVHKQVSNRLIEPWMWCEQIFSATEVENFFWLRDHRMAEPHFASLANQMHEQADKVKWLVNARGHGEYWRQEFGWNGGVVQNLLPGYWHLPFIDDEDGNETETLKKVSAARCARVSYLLPENGKKSTIERDVELFNRLAVREEGNNDPRHLSPLEHVALAVHYKGFIGNFKGFKQFRKEVPNEAGPSTAVLDR
jgi:hypothetical protein